MARPCQSALDRVVRGTAPSPAELPIPSHAAYAIVVAGTTLLVLACVLLHYEVLTILTRILPRLVGWQRRRILALIFSVLALHIVEIWIFGIGYFVLLLSHANGALQGVLYAGAPLGLLDHVYFSAVVYTTLGLGDIWPVGAIRFVTGTEALLGFVLVTWTASFTYIEMQRFWRTN